jgi:hypothetical protein
MAYYVGKTGYLSFVNSAGAAAVNLPLEEWSINLETEEVEFTNFESFGMKTILGGIRGGTVSGSGSYESVACNPVLTEFSTGTTSGKVVQLDLGLVRTGTPALVGIQVYAVLTSLTIGNNVKEKVTFEFEGTLTNMSSSTNLIVDAQNQPIAIV